MRQRKINMATHSGRAPCGGRGRPPGGRGEGPAHQDPVGDQGQRGKRRQSSRSEREGAGPEAGTPRWSKSWPGPRCRGPQEWLGRGLAGDSPWVGRGGQGRAQTPGEQDPAGGKQAGTWWQVALGTRGTGPHWARVQAPLAGCSGLPARRGTHLASPALHRCTCSHSERPGHGKPPARPPLPAWSSPALTAAEKCSPAARPGLLLAPHALPSPRGSAPHTGPMDEDWLQPSGSGWARPRHATCEKGLLLFQLPLGARGRCCKTQDTQVLGQSRRRSGPGARSHRLLSATGPRGSRAEGSAWAKAWRPGAAWPIVWGCRGEGRSYGSEQDREWCEKDLFPITLSSCLPLYLPISPYDPQNNYHLENAYSVLQIALST